MTSKGGALWSRDRVGGQVYACLIATRAGCRVRIGLAVEGFKLISGAGLAEEEGPGSKRGLFLFWLRDRRHTTRSANTTTDM